MKKLLTLVVLSTLILQLNAQESDQPERKTFKNDISVKLVSLDVRFNGSWFDGRSYLQYRRLVKPDWYIKGDISTRKEAPRGATFNHYIGDSSRIVNYLSFVNQDYTFRVGAEKNLKNGLFTVGASIINGVYHETRYYSQYAEEYNAVYDDWDRICSPNPDDNLMPCGSGYYRTRFYALGFSANANINLNLSRRLALTLLYEPEFTFYFNRGGAFDGFNDEFVAIEAPVFENSFGNLKHNIDLLLRFRF